MNFSIILKIFREGILAAMMGGFYIDFNEEAHFINIVHIYLWLILFGIPILVMMDYSSSIFVKIIVSCGVGLLILIIKMITNRLHFLFDTSEAIEVIKKNDNNIDENEIKLFQFPYSNDERPHIGTAIDQESMFQNGSVEDIQNVQVHREASKTNVTEGDMQASDSVNKPVTSELPNDTTPKTIVKNSSAIYTSSGALHLDQSTNFSNSNIKVSHNLQINNNTLPASSTSNTSVPRVPTTVRMNSARNKRLNSKKGFDRFASGSERRQMLHPPNNSGNKRALMSSRMTREMCMAELEKMSIEINQLHLPPVPTAMSSNTVSKDANDIELLQMAGSTRLPRNSSMAAIHRSRSSSQRVTNPVQPQLASGLSRRNSTAATATVDKQSALVGPNSGASSAHSSTATLSNIRASGGSLAFDSRRRKSYQMQRRRSSITAARNIPGVATGVTPLSVHRSHSLRSTGNPLTSAAPQDNSSVAIVAPLETPLGNAPRTGFTRRVSYHYPHHTETKVAATLSRRTQSFKSDFYSNTTSGTTTSTKYILNNPRYRAANSTATSRRSSSIDIGPITRPIFTIGSCQVASFDEAGSSSCCVTGGANVSVESSVCALHSRSKLRKASFDKKSHSLDTATDQQQLQHTQQYNSAFNKINYGGSINRQQILSKQRSVCEESQAICELDQTTTAPEYQQYVAGHDQDSGDRNLIDEMLARQLSMDDEEINALLLSNANNVENDPEKKTQSIRRNTIGSVIVTTANEILPVTPTQNLTTSTSVISTRPYAAPQITSSSTAVNPSVPRSQLESNVVSGGVGGDLTARPSLRPRHINLTEVSSAANIQEVSTGMPLVPVGAQAGASMVGLNPAAHDDTSEGSVHLFQDETGQWMVYVFGDDTGTAIPRKSYLQSLILQQKHHQTTGTSAQGGTLPRCDSPHPDIITRPSLRSDNDLVLLRQRRQSNTSIEQISILDRFLMTAPNSQSNTITGAASNEGSGSNHGISRGDGNLSSYQQLALILRDRSLNFPGRNSLLLHHHQDPNTGPSSSNSRFLPTVLSSTLPSVASPNGAGNNTLSLQQQQQDSIMLYDSLGKWFINDKCHLNQPSKHYYYELALLPWSPRKFRVDFDRLQLTSVFDRTTTWWEVALCCLLAILVSYLGLELLNRQIYRDFYMLVVCFIIASAQYSLVKSVQPDACSPQHGFNRILVYSRAVYFAVLASFILLLHSYLTTVPSGDSPPGITLFTIPITGRDSLTRLSRFLQTLLLLLPIFHTLGWLPQLNTMLLFIMEQIDINIFGASGSCDLVSASTSIIRNILASLFLLPLAFQALKSNNPQHICSSIFWGLHLALCYLLSRLPNNQWLYRQSWHFILRSFSNTHRAQSDIPTDPQHMEQRRRSRTSRLLRTPRNNSTHLKSGLLLPQQQQQGQTINFTPLTVPAPILEQTHPLTNKDPLPEFMHGLMVSRLKNDCFMCLLWAVLGFALHISSLFTQTHLQWILQPLLIYWCVAVGFLLHYLWSELTKPYPWLIFTRAYIKPSADGYSVTAWETVHYWLLWLQKNVFIPLLVMNEYTNAMLDINRKFGTLVGSMIVIISSMKLLRSGFNAHPWLYLQLLLTHLLFQYDLKHTPTANETFALNFLAVSIIFTRLYDLWLKLNFVFIYIAPFQISWGSAFHAVAQLAFLPHSMLLMGQCVLSSILSAPLEPFLASAIFISSYVRPIKFWEKKYRTQRLETTNTALSTQMQGISSEQVAGNLNSIFYEHLTRSLQKTLAGDLLLGRWGGAVEQGDMFILASEDLHFLVHIIEVTNGCVTFQLRGLEFAGTYCHEQETEELRTDPAKNRGVCCCNAAALPKRCLGLNVSLRLRWVAWQFVHNPFSIEGYRVTDHSATTTLQLYELRRLLTSLYVQSIIYFTAAHLNTPGNLQRIFRNLQEPLLLFSSPSQNLQTYVDLDPIFTKSFDDDYDELVSGVTRDKFLQVYNPWIDYCLEHNASSCSTTNHLSDLLQEQTEYADRFRTLCFALSLLGRRCVGYSNPDSSFKYNPIQHSVTDVFLHGLHDVFKGDVRVSKDDWIFNEVTLLQQVITPAVRIALKLYQDNLANPLTSLADVHQAITHTLASHVICHETEPQWRLAILNDADSLFSFRRIVKSCSTDGYRIITFSKKTLQFKVIKINRECVRGLWSSQQREQIFLRNNDQERGSIQHARQVLRNLINSSCDLPIGYPIYVSELTTSLAGSHVALRSVAGSEVSSLGLVRWCRSLVQMVRSVLHSGGGRRPRMEDGVGTAGVVAGGGSTSIAMSNLGPGSASQTVNSKLIYNNATGIYCLGGDKKEAATVDSQNGAAAADSPSDENSLYNNYMPVSSHRVFYSPSNASVDNGATTVVSLDPAASGTTTNKLYWLSDSSQILDRYHDKLTWPRDDWRQAATNKKLAISAVSLPMSVKVLHKWTAFNPSSAQRSFCHLTIDLVSPIEAPSQMFLVFDKALTPYDMPLPPPTTTTTTISTHPSN